MTTQAERHEFQAEVQQLLSLMIHSLYSNKEIFLRELISNASDALDKLRFEQVTQPELAAAGELHIRIEPDAEARTLSVIDNGIGMSREELIRNIGTIAKSGTKEFLAALEEARAKEVPPELIGQFGVGFYSAFMVAEKVEVITRRAGEKVATHWESTGDGAYTVAETERSEPGTTVIVHLKPVDDEQGLRDFADAFVLRDIVKRYSDFVGYPIRMKSWRKGGSSGPEASVLEDETLNSMKAIWDRPKGDVEESEYREFYRHISHDWNEPLETIAVKMEGTIEASALLFIPSKAPYDLYSQEMKRGVQLYVRRVFVMDECKDLLPAYLRFVKGVVDAHDLSLNVSREILQKDRQIQVIRRQLVRKVLGALETMRDNAREKYLGFWAELGPALKEGLLGSDEKEQERLSGLVLASSTAKGVELSSLDEYIGRMQEGQDAIYFLTGPSKEAVAKSPLLEAFAEKGIEVLLFHDPVDEIWLERAPKYKDKALVSIGRGEIELGSEDDRKKATEALDQKRRELGDLLTALRVHLQDEIKEVRLSSRLTSSAACLVGDKDDPTPQMQRILEQLGQSMPKVKRILELNPDHPIVAKLQAVFAGDANDPRLKSFAQLLYGQACVGETGHVPDPTSFTDALIDTMLRAL